MKLIVAIVQDEDAGRLVSALMDKGFGVTKLATTGGFLRAGNTTLISGVEDDKLQDALGVIEKICKSREQITASTTPACTAGTRESQSRRTISSCQPLASHSFLAIITS